MRRSGWLVIVGVVALLVAGGALSLLRPPTSRADPANTMSVDAISGGGIDTSRAVGDNAPFVVDIVITHGGSGADNWQGYDTVLCYDSAILNFVPTDDVDADTALESWHYTGLGSTVFDAAVTTSSVCPTGLGDTRLVGGSGRLSGTTNASGAAINATFACLSDGATTLHLVTQAESGAFSVTRGGGGGDLPTNLADATITCSTIPTPTPTHTPTSTPLPTATPTSTPTATATPVPDCWFIDDFDNGTDMSVWNSRWRFTGPGINMSADTGARMLGNVVFVFSRQGTKFIAGFGFCEYGPARFLALDFSAFQPGCWQEPDCMSRLLDVTPLE